MIALAQRARSSDREVYEVYGGAQRPVYSDCVAAKSTKRDQSNKYNHPVYLAIQDY